MSYIYFYLGMPRDSLTFNRICI